MDIRNDIEVRKYDQGQETEATIAIPTKGKSRRSTEEEDQDDDYIGTMKSSQLDIGEETKVAVGSKVEPTALTSRE